MSVVWPVLSDLDVRVLRATDARYVRTVERVAERAGCGVDVAKSVLGRLRMRMLVEDDGCRPRGWLRTYAGEVALEHQS
jgi:hypothetical protein